MLKASKTENFDLRKSLYRPVRPAKIEHREGWHCVNFDYPLVRIVKGCTIFDFFRAAADTTFMIILLMYTLELEYVDVMLVKSDFGIDEYEQDEPGNTTTQSSINRAEYTRLFNKKKETFCIILGIISVISAVEIPLAIFLFKAVQWEEKSHLVMWAQTSSIYIFFNFIAFIANLVYASKAGLILDNNTWVSEGGINLRFLHYMHLLRIAIFDVTKGAEVVFVNAYLRDIAKRNKAVKKIIGDGETAASKEIIAIA